MKKLYSVVFIFLLCFVLGACSAKIPFTKWEHSGKVSGTIWYTPDIASTSVIPLLVRAEWQDRPIQEGHIALLFLHGSLFAKCQYTDAQLVCEVENTFPGATTMANDSAMLVSTAINDMQGTPLPVNSLNSSESSDSLDSLQSLTSKSKENTSKETLSSKTLPRTYSVQDGKTSITFEIVEATWR